MTLTTVAGQAVGSSPSRIVFCAGLYGSGSTWIFNVTRQLFQTVLGAATSQLYLDEVGEIEEAALRSDDYLVLKSHRPSPAVRALTRMGNTPILLSVRDPRDAIVSQMTRFELLFEEALEGVKESAAALLPLREHPNMLLLRYETGFTREPNTLTMIGRQIGVTVHQTDRDALFAAHTPEAVTATIDKLEKRGVFGDASPANAWDPDTHWHPFHVGDGRVGKWSGYLSPRELAEVAKVTAAYCDAFDYRNVS